MTILTLVWPHYSGRTVMASLQSIIKISLFLWRICCTVYTFFTSKYCLFPQSNSSNLLVPTPLYFWVWNQHFQIFNLQSKHPCALVQVKDHFKRGVCEDRIHTTGDLVTGVVKVTGQRVGGYGQHVGYCCTIYMIRNQFNALCHFVTVTDNWCLHHFGGSTTLRVLLLTINPALGVRGGIPRSTSGTGWCSLVSNDREFFKQLTDMVGLENRACCYRLLPQPLRQREI